MRKRERSSQPDRPSLERSLDALLGAPPGQGPLPDADPARWQPVAQVLAALTSAPERGELTGEAQALAEFRARTRTRARHAERPSRPSRLPRRDPGRVTSRRRPRPLVAAATTGVLMGGLLAVAYAGDLPAAAQRLAHDTIDAPAGRSATPGPDPAGSSARHIPAGHASSAPAHEPGRALPTPGSPRRHGRSRPAADPAAGFPSGASGWPSRPAYGIPTQFPSPGGSPTPGPTQQPSATASVAPPAGASPSPSATSTWDSGHYHRPGPGDPQSTPP